MAGANYGGKNPILFKYNVILFIALNDFKTWASPFDTSDAKYCSFLYASNESFQSTGIRKTISLM